MSAIRVRALSRLGVIVSILISLVAVGCGKTSSVTHTVTVTRSAQATAVLTQAQTITAGDAICTTGIKRQDPLVAEIDAAGKSGLPKQEVELKIAPKLEQLAGVTRSTARALQELRSTPNSVDLLRRNYASSLLELSVIEEQWSEALREGEKARLGAVSKEVQEKRVYASNQAKGFGFKVCGASSRTPIG